MLKKLINIFSGSGYQQELDRYIARHNPKSEAEINKLIHKFNRRGFV
jgi:hypothetical protein